MLTLAAILTILMGMNALPARADMTVCGGGYTDSGGGLYDDGSSDNGMCTDAGGGGDYSGPIVTPISPPEPGDTAGCYDFCTTQLPGASGAFCRASCSGGDTSVNTPNGPQQPVRPL